MENLELLLSVGGLALLDTLSPATIGITIYLLLTETRNLAARLLLYLLTVATFYFIVGVMLMLGVGSLLDAFASLFQNKAVSWVGFVIGLILFIASFYMPQKQRQRIPRPTSKSRRAMVLLGISTGILEVGMAFPYFAAIGLMSTSDLSSIQWLPMLAGYNLIMILPPLVLYVLYLVLGNVMQKPFERLQTWITKHSGSALSWIVCIVGLILILNTLDYL